jgi:hypothetical protein
MYESDAGRTQEQVLTPRKAVTSKGVTKATTEHRRLGLSDFGEVQDHIC